MSDALTLMLLVCAAAGLGLYALGVWATLRHLQRRRHEPVLNDAPPLSLLKPIKGTEECLEDNLRSFFAQDYPGPIEVVFSSFDPQDPGITVARQVARAFPHVPVQFVVADPGFGLNPKVANLQGALAAASHDLVLQSDANVRVDPDYVRRIVAELQDRDGSLLTSLVAGVDERSAGAAMENLQLTAFIAPGMCAALYLAHVTCVVGKSMLLRRSELRDLGGLEIVRDVLAEDFVLGQRYEAAGKTVLLSPTPIFNVNRDIGVTRFLARHSRWLKMRVVIHLGGYFADLLANPVALLTAALIVSGFDLRVAVALLVACAVKATSDGYLVRLARGTPMALSHLALAPFKDMLMGLVWVHAAFSRSVCWRGLRLRFGAGSVLRPDDGALPLRLARRVLAPFRSTA